jgi:hypothetical protein
MLHRGVDGRIILEWFLNKLGDVNWIQVTQDRDHWWALLTTVMNVWFHKMLDFLD